MERSKLKDPAKVHVQPQVDLRNFLQENKVTDSDQKSANHRTAQVEMFNSHFLAQCVGFRIHTEFTKAQRLMGHAFVCCTQIRANIKRW